MSNNEMTKEEINTWTGGAWDCVCGETDIDDSFGCPSCDLTIIGSNMERRKRNQEAWATFAEEVNSAIANGKLQELIILRDKIKEAIEELQK